MKTIRPDRQAKIIPHRAAGYRRVGPVLQNDLAVDISNKIPGGGWCATPGDLARFAVALMRGRLVSSLTLERMWIPQKTSTGNQTEAGYGCFIRTVDGDRRISHSGGQPKVSTYLTFAPARKSAVAVMCNLRNARVQPLADKLMKLVGDKGDE
jgi:CubicO group peptidase (beta-lactamase class C family)